MKLLNWTRRFSRRGFLAGGAATIAAVAATSGTVLADAQAAPGAGPAELQPDEVRTLLKFTRDLFPHDRLEDSFYAKAIAPLEEEAAKDPSSRRLLGRGVAQLNRLAIAADGKPYADVPDEKLRVSVIKQIEGSAFFTKVYDTTITSLYNQREVWPKFGYQGPSSSLGGYVNRGFSDIDWL